MVFNRVVFSRMRLIRHARRTPRIPLATPLRGTVGNLPVRVVDLGPEGAAIEHERKLAANERHTLRIEWRQLFESGVRIRHSKLTRLAGSDAPAVYHTGLSFLGLTMEGIAIIESILIDEAKRQVVEWEANLTGTRRSRLPSLHHEMPRSARPRAFVWHRLVDGSWIESVTRDPNQPIDGFAICDDEDPRQVAMLRKAYETYDGEDRAMLRMMAHFAIASRIRVA